MALQWTPLRRRGGAVVRARQNVQTLEHQTQANVLLAFKLSMVSGNGVNSVTPSYRSYRKMADVGVQCDYDFNPQDGEISTVAEINTSADLDEMSPPPNPQRPLSVQSSKSSSSGEERERRKQPTEDLDVDAICVQQSTTDLSAIPDPVEKTEPDGFLIQEKEDSSCGLDCVYFTMQCCECTIL